MPGFDIIECADLDEAIDVASKHPMVDAVHKEGIGTSNPGRAGERAGAKCEDAAAYSGPAPSAAYTGDKTAASTIRSTSASA